MGKTTMARQDHDSHGQDHDSHRQDHDGHMEMMTAEMMMDPLQGVEFTMPGRA